MSYTHTYENQEQAALFEWATLQLGRYPVLELMYHIPNGGSRNKLEAINLKRQGVKAGVPDIHLPVARGKYHSLYIELKTDKGKVSDKQETWIKKLRHENNCAMVCRGWAAAAQVIEKYLNLPSAKRDANDH